MAELVAAHGMPIGDESGRPQQLIVLAMGKQGGGELNVSSDIDLIFVYPEDGDTAAAGRPAPAVEPRILHPPGQAPDRRRCPRSSKTASRSGSTWRCARTATPGPLAASFEHGRGIPDRPGPRMGALRLGQGARRDRRRRTTSPRWTRSCGRSCSGATSTSASIDAIRNMHAQIRAEVNRQERLHPDRSNNVKLGRGGIREIEFLAQVFQLIRGGRDAGPARALHPRHAARAGRARSCWRPTPSSACWRPTPSCATSNTGCNTWTTPRPTPCRRATPTA